MSCISLLYIALLGTVGLVDGQAPAAVAPLATAASAPSNPDALYAAREDLAERTACRGHLGRAAETESPRLRRRRGSWREPATGLADTRPRPSASSSSRTASRPAARRWPSSRITPEGHFWIAANMGALAESFGMRQGLKYRGTIKDELLTVLKLDPAFQEGSADRALGRWYYKVPGLFGGSKQKSEEHLRALAHVRPGQHRVALLPRRDACSISIAATRRARSCSVSSTRRSILTGRRRIGNSRRRRRRSSRRCSNVGTRESGIGIRETS